MKRLLQKLKDRLIKWLGGYTEREYRSALTIPASLVNPLRIERTRPILLRTYREFPSEELARAGAAASEYAIRQVISDLHNEIRPHIIMHSTENRMRDTIVVEAALRIAPYEGVRNVEV